nr:hypothetical protein [Plesiomonas shigelloides]
MFAFGGRGTGAFCPDRRQKTEDRRQKTEDRRQKTSAFALEGKTAAEVFDFGCRMA